MENFPGGCPCSKRLVEKYPHPGHFSGRTREKNGYSWTSIPKRLTCRKLARLKKILLFGAGKSASVLIDYLLTESLKNDWMVTVADASLDLARSKTNNHPNAIPIGLDINDAPARRSLVADASLVISMMPPALHILIARDCIEFGKHLLTASYADDEIKSLDAKAREKGILFLCEMGLDPGIDHMSAMQIIDEIHASGGTVRVFRSHCGGLVAPESDDNPWHYKISWNPRNVVLAGKAGAIYRQGGKTVEEPYEQLFNPERVVDIHDPSIGRLSYYPNRNSLPYIDLYGLQSAVEFVRTTLRYPDFMFGWKNLVELKMTDETPMYQTDGKSLLDFYKEHMQKHGFGEWLDHKLSERFSQTKDLLEKLNKLMEIEQESAFHGEAAPDHLLMVDEKGELQDIDLDAMKAKAAAEVNQKIHEANLTLKQLFFLGLDDKDSMINKGFCSAADVLQLALETKLALKPGDKDMIVMLHEIGYTLNGKQHMINSQLVVKGDDHIHTAMAKTVGLPLGIAAKLLLTGKLNINGVHIPVTKEFYEPVLEELKKHQVIFHETRQDVQS